MLPEIKEKTFICRFFDKDLSGITLWQYRKYKSLKTFIHIRLYTLNKPMIKNNNLLTLYSEAPEASCGRGGAETAERATQGQQRRQYLRSEVV